VSAGDEERVVEEANGEGAWDRTTPAAPASRPLEPELLHRLAGELASAVGRHGAVTVEGGELHLHTSGRANYREAARAAARLTHWPAGVRVVVHRAAPKVPETAAEKRRRAVRAELESKGVEIRPRGEGGGR